MVHDASQTVIILRKFKFVKSIVRVSRASARYLMRWLRGPRMISSNLWIDTSSKDSILQWIPWSLTNLWKISQTIHCTSPEHCLYLATVCLCIFGKRREKSAKNMFCLFQFFSNHPDKCRCQSLYSGRTHYRTFDWDVISLILWLASLQTLTVSSYRNDTKHNAYDETGTDRKSCTVRIVTTVNMGILSLWVWYLRHNESVWFEIRFSELSFMISNQSCENHWSNLQAWYAHSHRQDDSYRTILCVLSPFRIWWNYQSDFSGKIMNKFSQNFKCFHNFSKKVWSSNSNHVFYVHQFENWDCECLLCYNDHSLSKNLLISEIPMKKNEV